MATSLQISRQFQRELHAHQEGKTRLQEATRRAEERSYASSSVYGNKLIAQGLGSTIEAIEDKRSKIAAGSTAEYAAHVAMLEGIPSSTLALITLKSTIDVVFEKRNARAFGHTSWRSYHEVVAAVGSRVYDECLLSEFSQAFPEDFKGTRIHRSKGYGYRVAKYRATMRRIGHEALKWPSGHKVKVGAWLLDRLCQATGWFASKTIQASSRKKQVILIPDPEVLASIDAINQAAEEISACKWPMLCEPNDWQGDLKAEPGGYLTGELRSGAGYRLVRGLSHSKLSQSFPLFAQEGQGETATPMMEGDEEGKKKVNPAIACLLPSHPQESSNDPEHVRCHPPQGSPSYSLEVPVRFLNSIQKVGFQVNQAVLGVALQCQEARVSIGSFRQSDPLPLPHKPEPWDTATEEEKTAYKKARVLVEEENSLLAQRNYQTSETLHIAKMYYTEESFWFPWSFDFRGRVYPLSHHLTPQGTDLSRALLVSAMCGPADQQWLAFQVATTWGLGKETLWDRQAWVRDNLQLIKAVAQDPMGTISTWQGADEPWQFLAACIEYNDCIIQGTRSWSNLLVGFDATCSGLQHLSALTRDRGAAELVNVAPTHKPADAYKTVAEASKKYLPEEFHPLITRKVTKRVVMTIPYNLTKSSARDYLRQALPKEHGIPIKDLTHAVYDLAVPEVLPGPMRAKRWIQEAVDAVANQTGRPVAFASPSGFPVILDKRIYPTEQVDTKLLGRRIRVTVADFDSQAAPINRRKITIGAMPNFIHSLDAALLHRAFAEWDRPLATVHDCISTLSCDVAWTMDHIRETFATMYEEDQLALWADQLGVPVDPEVMIGTLDPAEIRESNYLFC